MASLPTLKSRNLIQVDGENDSGEYDISVVTYNILADFHLQQSLSKESSTYKNCSQEYVKPKQDRSCPRHKLLLTELKLLDGDIVCLQEVDPPYFAGILREDMSLLGYDGLLAQKSRFKEGVALFFKKNKFDLQESKALVLDEIATDVFKVAESDKFGEALILAALRHNDSNTMVLTGNTHILWMDLLEPVTQVCEIALVTQAMCDMVTSLKSPDNHVAYILCGDFNIDPCYPAYHLLKDGHLSEEQFCKLQTVDYLQFSGYMEKPNQVLPEQISLLGKFKKNLYNPLKSIQSAYKALMGSEPQCTGVEGDASCFWTMDYIWFDSDNLKVTAALETLPQSTVAAYGNFPNEYFSSDHFSLKANFKLIKNL